MKVYKHYPWFIAFLVPFCLIQVACGSTSTNVGHAPPATAAPTPAPGPRVYVLGNQLTALDSGNGHAVWQHTYLQNTVPHMTVTATTLYLAADHLEALRTADGVALWQTPQSTLGATLVLADARHVYVEAQQQVMAFAVADGRQAWTTPADDQQAPVLAADGQILYVTTANQIHAVNTTTGALRWTTPAAAIGTIDAPVAVGDLAVDVVNDPSSTQSQIVAYHESDGSVAWTATAPVGPFVAHDATHVYAVAENLQTQTDQLMAFDTSTGAQDWTLTYPYAVSTQAIVQGSTLYVSEGQGTLVAVDTALGHPIWQQQQQQNALQLLVVGSHGYVVWDGGDVTAFTTAQGATVWIDPQQAQLAAATPDTLYLIANTTTLIAVVATSGVQRWHAPLATTLTGAVQVMLAP